MNAKLVYWMAKKSFGVKDLAEKAGLSRGHIVSLRNGRRKGSIDVWEKIADALGITLDQLRDKEE